MVLKNLPPGQLCASQWCLFSSSRLILLQEVLPAVRPLLKDSWGNQRGLPDSRQGQKRLHRRVRTQVCKTLTHRDEMHDLLVNLETVDQYKDSSPVHISDCSCMCVCVHLCRFFLQLFIPTARTLTEAETKSFISAADNNSDGRLGVEGQFLIYLNCVRTSGVFLAYLLGLSMWGVTCTHMRGHDVFPLVCNWSQKLHTISEAFWKNHGTDFSLKKTLFQWLTHARGFATPLTSFWLGLYDFKRLNVSVFCRIPEPGLVLIFTEGKQLKSSCLLQLLQLKALLILALLFTDFNMMAECFPLCTSDNQWY